MDNQDMNKKYSRKEMLHMTGKGLAGVAMVGAIPTILGGCSGEDDKDEKQAATNIDVKIPAKEDLEYDYIEKSEDHTDHPFVYQKLDKATVMERTHASFYNKGGCCAAVADGIVGELGDKAGYPFNQIPMEAFTNGAAGYGSGSLCGSLGGAAFAIALVCDPAEAKEVTQEVFTWYRESELPQYMPVMEVETVVPDSVNCDESVGKFMDAANVKMGDDPRLERCACVSADVAGKVVEILNERLV